LLKICDDALLPYLIRNGSYGEAGIMCRAYILNYKKNALQKLEWMGVLIGDNLGV